MSYPLKVELHDHTLPAGIHAARASQHSPGNYRTACNSGFDTGNKLTWHPHDTSATCTRCQSAT